MSSFVSDDAAMETREAWAAKPRRRSQHSRLPRTDHDAYQTA